MTVTAYPKNRTTVRPDSVTVRAARASFRVLGAHAPTLASRWAEHLFLSPRRHERPFWEREALASATPDRIRHGAGWIPTWTWSPIASGFTAEAPKTVILVHGWEGRGSQLANFVHPLLDRGLSVVTFDAPGHGDSTLAYGSVVEHALALHTVARAVGHVHAVVAHSVGGAAALFATRRGFAADRYALVAPPSSPKQFAAMFARTLGIDDGIKRRMIARLEERYSVPFEELDARLDATKLAGRLLVVHDKDDPVVSVEQGRAIAELAPRGSFMETTGLGHRAILRAQPVVEAIAAFVAEGTRSRSFAETIDGELFLRDARWRRLSSA